MQLATPALAALRVQLMGRVQGAGVRPAIARLALRLGLAGCVGNTLRGLEIEIEGQADAVALFQAGLCAELPPGCDVCDQCVEPIPLGERREFEIVRDAADGPLVTFVPPDTAVCGRCLEESQSPDDRRSGYSLISCAACGPRYSLIRRMPYERDETALVGFRLCDECADEYTSSADRRFHAQTTACSKCGPNVWAASAAGRTIGAGGEAVAAALAALRDGRIVAVCGAGGYQLLCDAADEQAISRLRARKSRPTKPLAVLVSSLEAASEIASLDDAERCALTSAANPIVLLRRRRTSTLATSIHPDLNTVGVLLPTTALHDQLARGFGRPLVCTSGNREGDPLDFEPDAAGHNLQGIADLWLHHDRPIVRPIDDSVVRIIGGRPVTIRLARGLAPLPLELPARRPLVALGGHQKAAVAWCNGEQSVLGPHLGDLDSLTTRERFLQQLASVEQLYRFTPEAFACDRHPGYFTSAWAAGARLPPFGILHHHAHIAAGMLEHGLLDEPVLGVAFDGTGLGADGAVWGGEFLFVHDLEHMERVAHLRPFVLPGGEAAIREPWRVAVGVLQQSVGTEAALVHGFGRIGRERVVSMLPLLARPRLGVVTTSAGRLFDAAACLILGIVAAQFDGEPAMRLEDVAEHTDEEQYPLPLTNDRPRQLDWRPLFAALWSDCRRGRSAGAMSMRFHRALAAGIAAVVRESPGVPVILGGGVFQNRLLSELVVAELNETRQLCLPGRIPPNDGGLAAGQLAIALSAHARRM